MADRNYILSFNMTDGTTKNAGFSVQAGEKGDKGDKGDRGFKGEQGEQGIKGDTGDGGGEQWETVAYGLNASIDILPSILPDTKYRVTYTVWAEPEATQATPYYENTIYSEYILITPKTTDAAYFAENYGFYILMPFSAGGQETAPIENLIVSLGGGNYGGGSMSLRMYNSGDAWNLKILKVERLLTNV